MHYASVAGMHNQVEVRFYATLATTSYTAVTIYDSTANPTSWRLFQNFAAPPSNARWARVMVIGGVDGDGGAAGSAYFDGVEVSSPIPTTGAHYEGITEAFLLTTYPSWGAAGSVSFYLPSLSSNSKVRLTIAGKIKSNNAERTAYQRFRVGSQYSGEGSQLGTAYKTINYIINLCGVSGTQTMYMELATDDGPGLGVYGKMDPGDLTVEILNP